MIDGVLIKRLIHHSDERGFFEEVLRRSDPFFTEGFGQLSRSTMHQGVVKAWHIHKTQIDWWYVVAGRIKVALYDMRPHSPTHKMFDEMLLDDSENTIVVKIPPGIAHGLKVLVGPATLMYVTNGEYTKDEEGRIVYNDPSIGYDWAQGTPITNKNIF